MTAVRREERDKKVNKENTDKYKKRKMSLLDKGSNGEGEQRRGKEQIGERRNIINTYQKREENKLEKLSLFDEENHESEQRWIRKIKREKRGNTVKKVQDKKRD